MVDLRHSTWLAFFSFATVWDELHVHVLGTVDIPSPHSKLSPAANPGSSGLSLQRGV